MFVKKVYQLISHFLLIFILLDPKKLNDPDFFFAYEYQKYAGF
jgi:hypothetical protein